MLDHRRTLRRHAARLLLAWLFGVIMGVANACALGPHDETAGHAVATADASHARDNAAAQADANCLDLCEPAALGAPPSAKLGGDNPMSSGLPALAPGQAMPVPPQPPSPLARSAAPPLRGSLPTRIAYQRLAL